MQERNTMIWPNAPASTPEPTHTEVALALSGDDDCVQLGHVYLTNRDRVEARRERRVRWRFFLGLDHNVVRVYSVVCV